MCEYEQPSNLPDCVPLEIKSECTLCCTDAYDQWFSVFWLKHTKKKCSNSSPQQCLPLSSVSDLIYMVLDLVPVLQVKQLVRSLGVKDIEIEQLELDYRSCREAHYQMIRVWAEKGARAGGMLHLPLLQELLDELRKMHLEWAAEELKTNYGFQ